VSLQLCPIHPEVLLSGYGNLRIQGGGIEGYMQDRQGIYFDSYMKFIQMF